MQNMYNSDANILVLYHKAEALVDRYLDTATPPWIKVATVHVIAYSLLFIINVCLDFHPTRDSYRDCVCSSRALLFQDTC